MDIVIFKKNEIQPCLFKGLISFKYIEYNSIDDLKNKDYGNFKDLDSTKCKIDTLTKEYEKSRRAAAKYLHEYELVKLICKKQVISRAYFKLYEMVYFEPIMIEETLDCFFICEAPGGFIECISDIRRKKNLKMNYKSISVLDNSIKYDKYLDSDNLMHGDITRINIIDSTISNVLSKFPNKLNFITADGGFDVKNFNSQEILSSKLILCEIYLALSTQKQGGMFIIKMFDMFTHNSIIYYFILCTFYQYVKIIKPKTSRNSNSERYLMCYEFKGINVNNSFILSDIRNTISNYVYSEHGIYTIIYPDFSYPNNKISYYNNIILSEQIKTINESIKMAQSKNTYFQSLLLKLFIEKVPIQYVFFYKNILNSRIKKCIEWLRLHNINTNQIVYRFE